MCFHIRFQRSVPQVIGQYLHGLPLTLCAARPSEGPVVWVSGRRKQRPPRMNTRPQHGWLTSKFASTLRHRRDKERPSGQKSKRYLLSFIFPQRGHPQIKHPNKKALLETQTEETTTDNWYVSTCWGKRTARSSTSRTAIVLPFPTTEDSLKIQPNEMFASPPSLLWQAFMTIPSRSSRSTYPS